MLTVIHFLNVFMPILYFSAFIFYAYDFFKEKEFFKKSKSALLFIILIIHIFYLVIRTIEFNHPPITTKFEIYTLIAAAVIFSYFLLELLTEIRGTGAFIIIVALIFQVFSSIFIEDLIEVQEVLKNRLLGLHVVSAILGYAGFTVSAVYGILFLVMYKKIKKSKFDLIYNRLPSLEIMERLSYDSLVIGFVLLTIALIIGFTWLPSAFPEFSYFDPKIVSTTIVWLIFAVGILTKIIAKWYGKKVIYFSLIGFGAAILSLGLTNIISQSFHSFY